MSNQTESAPGTLSRQELYDRIRETTKDEYILTEMIRLGYWKEESGKPSLPTQLIQEESKLRKRLNELLERQRLIENPELALKLLHKERKKAALEKRELTKQLKNQQRYDRAMDWYKAKQKEMLFLGQNLAIGLRNDEANPERLAKQCLPNFATGEELAQAMGVSINELRFLSYDRKTAKINHYQQFFIAKKTGGTRRISAPMPRIKRLQYWILGNILSKVSLHEAAHGFVPERSIVTNAAPHVGKSLVINMDLQNFFPTITYRRIKGLFVGFGYSEKTATVLGLLCSEAERDEVILDGESYHSARTERYLPQGAPTSPVISNLICRNLDKRIQGTVAQLNFNYTRYADDLTFSYNGDDEAPLMQLMWRVRKIIADEGFIIHPDKTRIMRPHKRQEVTGIVVNKKLSINKANLKRFRALLFQIDKDGPSGKSWGQGELFNTITGYANYIAMVNPEKGLAFKEQVLALKVKYQNLPTEQFKPTELTRARFKENAIAGKAPKANWWQAVAPEQPKVESTFKETEAQKKEIRQENRQARQDSHDNQNASNNSQPANNRSNRAAKGGFLGWVKCITKR